MPKLADYEIDPKRLDDGVWWDFGTQSTCLGNAPAVGRGCFRIRPLLGNRDFNSAMVEGETKAAGVLRDRETPESTKRELRQAIWARATARCVLIGWAGWDDLPPYDEQQAIALLTDRKWAAVAEFVVRASTEQRAAMVREEEQAQGN